MTTPSVSITQLDGSLGILPPSAGRMPAFVGPCSSGTAATPAAFGSIPSLVAALGKGPLVEAAAHFIERYGKAVLCVKTAASVAASAGTVSQSGTGATVATVHTGAAPDDDYEIKILCVTGGTVGVAGITYKYSLDGGRNYGATKALGTDTSITIAEAGTLVVDLTTATWVAGDSISFLTHAATWNSSDLAAALPALAASVQPWRNAIIVGPLDGTTFDTVDTAVSGMAAAGSYHGAICSFRVPNASESEAAYLTAFGAAFNAKSSTRVAVCAGACKVLSSVSGRRYRRPFQFVAAARAASLSEEQNAAALALGSLPCDIRDANGNVDEHDETINPGLDDARAIVARTFLGVQGVFVNRPLILSAAGSDFDILPKRDVMDLAMSAVRIFLAYRLNEPIRVDPKTGWIYEPDAREIEAGAAAAMADVLAAEPKASSWSFVVDRMTNVLSTKSVTGQARIVPLGYPETISVKMGYQNPALVTTSP